MEYDLVVVGSGVAATAVATRVREAGWRVAVVDFRAFGGTCALRGCDPKKVLFAGAETVDLARRMSDNGVAGELRIDWPRLMAFKRRFTDPVPAEREALYSKAGIEALHGRARFTGPNAMSVDGRNFQARHFVLACGAEPVKLGIPGEEHVITSEQFLDLDRLPHRIVLIGGGYIAAEFSGIAAASGTKVTVMQHGERMLTGFDPDLVKLLMERFAGVGIDVQLNTKVEAVEKTANAFVVHAGASRVEADLVVHAAGRRPDFGPLELEAANVSVKEGRLELNDFLQSVSNRSVYAAGDAAGKGPPLTPIASYDAGLVSQNLLKGNTAKAQYGAVPSVAFTLPPIAGVGMSEAAARKSGRRFRAHYLDARGWYTARRVGEPAYGFKTLVEEGSGRILGAHVLGPGAEDTINVFALAIASGMTADTLKRTIFAYPTAASDIASML